MNTFMLEMRSSKFCLCREITKISSFVIKGLSEAHRVYSVFAFLIANLRGLSAVA